jgi:uncharacterized membrane protein YfcA
MFNPPLLIGIGILVGIYSGIMGLGGGTIMIPVLVLLLGFSQHQAIGTSLAVMIPPVTLPAVIQYYREGHVDLRIAAWIALGFLAGAILGGFVANKLSDHQMKMIFGFVLVYIGSYTAFNILGSQHLVRTLILAGVLTSVAAIAWYAVKVSDARRPQASIAALDKQ